MVFVSWFQSIRQGEQGENAALEFKDRVSGAHRKQGMEGDVPCGLLTPHSSLSFSLFPSRLHRVSLPQATGLAALVGATLH